MHFDTLEISNCHDNVKAFLLNNEQFDSFNNILTE